MRELVCLSFLLFSFSAFSQGEAKTEIQWLSIERAEELAKKYDSHMLIFFFRKGCLDCKRMKRENNDSLMCRIGNEYYNYPDW